MQRGGPASRARRQRDTRGRPRVPRSPPGKKALPRPRWREPPPGRGGPGRSPSPIRKWEQRGEAGGVPGAALPGGRRQVCGGAERQAPTGEGGRTHGRTDGGSPGGGGGGRAEGRRFCVSAEIAGSVTLYRWSREGGGGEGSFKSPLNNAWVFNVIISCKS